jgi:hypothetical protein
MTYGLLLSPLLIIAMLGLRVRVWSILASTAAGVALISIWLTGHLVDGHHAFPSILPLARFVLLIFGSSWSCVSEWFGVGVAMIALPTATGLYIWVLLKRQKDVFAIVLLSLAMFALASSALIAFGRFEMGLDQARTQRYQTGPLLFWCCLSVLAIRRATKTVRASGVLIAIQVAILFVVLAAARLAPQYAAGLRQHSESIGAAALAIESEVNDSPTIMYAAIPPYKSEDILIMSSYLRSRHWSIFNTAREYYLGREFGRFYRIVAPVACRGELDAVRAFDDYHWSGFRFSGWAYDVAARAPATAVGLVDSTGRLIGMARPGFQHSDAPNETSREGVGFLGYVSADLKAREVRTFAILADRVSACPMIGGRPLYLDFPEPPYSRLEPTGATINLTRDLRPAAMNIEMLANKTISNGSPPVVEGTNNENWITGWIVDANHRSGIAADLAIDDVPVRAEYGYNRPDIARALSAPEAIACGFRCRLPRLSAGEHRVGMRVIPKGQDVYCEGWTLKIFVR